MTLKYLSLFSGYGGLDLAVEDVLGARPVGHVEIDPAASKVLAHHWPGVPNFGDITAVDWSTAGPVDVLTGGFPCQDVSLAGARAGLGDGTRSGLWTHFAAAVGALRPRLVIAENVRGLLSAKAAGHVEPCPWCVGDRPDHCLRALGAVLADLAGLRYDAVWCGLRASDVGAPHERYRVFIAAADTDQPRREGPEPTRGRDLSSRGAASHADGVGPERARQARNRGHGPADVGVAATDSSGVGRGEGWPEPAGLIGGLDVAVGGGASASHADGGGRGRDESGARRGTVGGAGDRPAGVDWGVYAPAVRRWELILGRPAPHPTMRGARGATVLSPQLPEWMMGLPAGWVTGVAGLSRRDMLRILGNGVVPQQAGAALRYLVGLLATGVERAA